MAGRYKVEDPYDGRMRRYKVTISTVEAWRELAAKWPSIATSELMDAFEQEYEAASDNCSWSGSRMRADDAVAILLDLAEKHRSGKF